MVHDLHAPPQKQHPRGRPLKPVCLPFQPRSFPESSSLCPICSPPCRPGRGKGITNVLGILVGCTRAGSSMRFGKISKHRLRKLSLAWRCWRCTRRSTWWSKTLGNRRRSCRQGRKGRKVPLDRSEYARVSSAADTVSPGCPSEQGVSYARLK